MTGVVHYGCYSYKMRRVYGIKNEGGCVGAGEFKETMNGCLTGNTGKGE